MIWIASTILLSVVLAPAALSMRHRVHVRGRKDAAIALYQAQAVELDRDLAEARISAAEHKTALLEVQRRLLAAADVADSPEKRADRGPLLLGLALIPLAAFGLYLVAGRPDLPAQPLALRMNEADKRLAEEAVMADQLRAALAAVDPKSEKARQGETLLGNIEASRGDFADAAADWGKALAVRFDPLLAAQVADATSRAEGRVSKASADLFRQALASAPPDAPWRGEVEQRLTEVPSSP